MLMPQLNFYAYNIIVALTTPIVFIMLHVIKFTAIMKTVLFGIVIIFSKIRSIFNITNLSGILWNLKKRNKTTPNLFFAISIFGIDVNVLDLVIGVGGCGLTIVSYYLIRGLYVDASRIAANRQALEQTRDNEIFLTIKSYFESCQHKFVGHPILNYYGARTPLEGRYSKLRNVLPDPNDHAEFMKLVDKWSLKFLDNRWSDGDIANFTIDLKKEITLVFNKMHFTNIRRLSDDGQYIPLTPEEIHKLKIELVDFLFQVSVHMISFY